MFKVTHINNKTTYNVVSVTVERLSSQEPKTTFLILDNGHLISAPSDIFEPIAPSPFIIRDDSFQHGYYIHSTLSSNWILVYCFSEARKKETWSWIPTNKFKIETKRLD